MTQKAAALTPLELKRLKTLKRLIALMLTLGLVLAACQWYESASSEYSATRQALSLFNSEQPGEDVTAYPGDTSNQDPLMIEQSGLACMQIQEEANIYWYQSEWSIEETKVLLERTLALQGWVCIGSEHEQLMSFVYQPSARASGGFLIANLYALEDGCTVLIEAL